MDTLFSLSYNLGFIYCYAAVMYGTGYHCFAVCVLQIISL